MNDYIGRYVKQFESGSQGSYALAQCGNDWGLSCGSYQLTLRWGNCIRFLKKFFPEESEKLYYNGPDFISTEFPGEQYSSAPNVVKKIWAECIEKVGEEQFFSYEHDYMTQNFYNPIKAQLKNYINLDKTSRALQECFWSWAIHRGPVGAMNEFNAAIAGKNIYSMQPEELFDLLYDKRFSTFSYDRYRKGYAYGERETLRPLIYTAGIGVTDITSPIRAIKEENTTASSSYAPIKCIMTNSTCYKGSKNGMQPIGILWHSTGCNNPNIKAYVQPSPEDKNYSSLLDTIGVNEQGTDWNHIYREAGVHAWIGKLRDGTIGTVQTLPWTYFPWGCGSGKYGSCNSGYIQFEICEDSLTNTTYFNRVYQEACKLTAYLCRMYNINPKGYVNHCGVKTPTILCHADAYKLGLGSNHADIYHWFNRYNKTMYDVRRDVAKILAEEEDDDMITQEQFNAMMNEYLKQLSKDLPNDWSKEARNWCEDNGIINGDEKGNCMYKKFLTREEVAAIIYRLHGKE